MSSTNSVSDRQLNPAGHFVNGALSSTVMMTGIQWLFGIKTHVYKQRSLKGLPPFPQVILYLNRGFLANCSSVVPSLGSAFCMNGLLSKVNKDKEDSDMRKLLTGAAAGAAGAPAACAFDRIVIVCQGEGKKPLEVCREILSKEGLRGFSKGFGPTLLREVPGGVTIFALSGQAEKRLEGTIANEKVRNGVSNFVTGFLAGFVTTTPDRVKTLMQSDRTGKCSSMVNTAKKIVVEEGAHGLLKGGGWRGLFVGLGFTILGYTKNIIPHYLPDNMHEKK